MSITHYSSRNTLQQPPCRTEVMDASRSEDVKALWNAGVIKTFAQG
jgi:hypothetical protein